MEVKDNLFELPCFETHQYKQDAEKALVEFATRCMVVEKAIASGESKDYIKFQARLLTESRIGWLRYALRKAVENGEIRQGAADKVYESAKATERELLKPLEGAA